MKMRRLFPERFKWRMNDRLPGQTLKRKKWIYASIVLICATFDVLLLFIANNAISPLLEDAPYLPQKYAQEYTHLATFRAPSRRRYREAIDAIAFSPNGQTLAAGGYQEVHLWDVGASNLISTFKEHQGWIKAVAFSPDGKTAASVSEDRERRAHGQVVPYTIRLWDTETRISRLTFTQSISPLTALEFSPDSTKLLIATQHGFIDVYDSNTGRRDLENFLYVYDGILNKIGTIAFAASPDNTIITRWVWKTDGFMPSRTPTTEVYRRFSFSYGNWFDEFRLVGDPSIGLNRGMDRRCLFLIPNTYRVNALAFSPNGKILASGGRDTEFRLYNIADGKIQLWNADSGSLLHTFNSPGGRVKLLVFSPDGKTLASVGDGWWKKIFIWDLENRRLLSIINTGERKIKALQFAPDSITLASAHVDGTVHLWDITGRVKKGKHMIENEGRKELK